MDVRIRVTTWMLYQIKVVWN